MFGGSSYRNIQSAPINSDGTLGAWVTDGILTAVNSGYNYGKAVVTNNRVYLIAGDKDGNGGSVLTAPINSDGSLGSWSESASLPIAMAASYVAIIKDKIYVLGGSVSGTATNKVYYTTINTDGTIGSWVAGTNLPIIAVGGDVFVTKNMIYLIQGMSSSSTDRVLLRAPINLDGTLGVWVSEGNTSLAYGLIYSNIFVVKNKVYFAGGVDINTGTSVNHVYMADLTIILRTIMEQFFLLIHHFQVISSHCLI